MKLGLFRRMRLVNVILCLAFCLNLVFPGKALAFGKFEEISMLRPKAASNRIEGTVLGMDIELIRQLSQEGLNALKRTLADRALDGVQDPGERKLIEEGIGILEKEGKIYIVCLIGNGWKVDLSKAEIEIEPFASEEERNEFISGGQLTWLAGEYTPAQIIDAQAETQAVLQEAGRDNRIFTRDRLAEQVALYSAERTSVRRQLPPLKSAAQEALVKRLQAAFAFNRESIDTLTQEDIDAMMPIGLSPAYSIKVGAEDFSLKGGSAVGTITLDHLREIGIVDSVVGHSATRSTIIYERTLEGEIREKGVQKGDTNFDVRDKLEAALKNGIKVTLCVGENIKTREQDRNALGFVIEQLEADLGRLGLSGPQVLALLEAVAYEPLWAIGTDVAAKPEDIQEMHAKIRRWFANVYGQDVASKIVLKYGGSVKPENAEEIFALKDVDGALIGGASLKADSFAKIAQIADAAGRRKGKTMHISANWKAEEVQKRDTLEAHLKELAAVGLQNTAINYYLPFTLLAGSRDLLSVARSPKLFEVKQDLEKVREAIVLDEEDNPSFYYEGEAGSSKFLAVTASSGGFRYEGYDAERAGGRAPRSNYDNLAMVESYMEMAKDNPEALRAYRLKLLHEYFEVSSDSKYHRQESEEVIALINKYDQMALDMWKEREATKAKAKLARENKKVIMESASADIAKFLNPELDGVIPPELIEVAEQELQKLIDSGLLTDYRIIVNAGEFHIIITRQNRNAIEDDAKVPPAMVDMFLSVLDKAKEMRIYIGEDLSKKSYLEQARALEIRRPYQPLKYTERAADPFGVFVASNTYVGAHNMLIFQILSDPMYNAGLTIDPEMMRGFIFEVWDTVEDVVYRFDGETENNKLRALANQPGRYAIVAVYTKAEHKVASDEPVITVSVKRMADDGKSSVGDFSPVLIVRSQSGLPAWGELIAPTGTAMPILTYGGDKTQRIVVWRPTSMDEAKGIPASGRQGLSILTGFGFQSHDNGRFGVIEDIGAHQSLIPARENAEKWAELFYGEAEVKQPEPPTTSILERMKTEPQEKIRVAINGGAGRIGTTVIRAWLRDSSKQVEVVAINDAAFNFSSKDMTPEEQLQAYVDMLYDDTVHRRLASDINKEDIKVGQQERDGKTYYYIDIKGEKIYVSDGRDPAQLPWGEHDVDAVIEATGRFTDATLASKHLDSGAKLVIISAPPKGDVPTLVMGVNQSMLDKAAHKVVSNASCTTNCLAPVAAILQQAFGVVNGTMDTVHAFTGDQATVDLFRPSAPMRGKAASENILTTTTGAAKAIGAVIPELQGKLAGIAERVSVSDASMLILTVNLERPTNKEEINQLFKQAAGGVLKGILAYEDKPIASTSVIGRPESAIVIGDLTQVSSDGKTVTVRAWYDNEFGYSARLLDLAQYANSTFAGEREREVLVKRARRTMPEYMNHITELQPFKTPHEYLRDDRVVATRQRLDRRFLRNPDLKEGEVDPLLQAYGDYAISNLKADIGSVPGHYKPHRVTIRALNDILEIARIYGFQGVDQYLALAKVVMLLRTGLTIDEVVSKNGLYRKGGSDALIEKVNEFREKVRITNWDEAIDYIREKTQDESLIALATRLKETNLYFPSFMDILVGQANREAAAYFELTEQRKPTDAELEVLSTMIGLTAGAAKSAFEDVSISEALGLRTDLPEQDKLLDFTVWSSGDDSQLTMKHRRLAEDKLIHTLAWNALWYAADQTSYFKPYGWKQDILVDRLVSGNIQGAGPGYAELQLNEGEDALVFSADKCAPGAFTVPTLGMLRKAIAEGKFPNGVIAEIWDINNRPRAFFDLADPEQFQDALTLLSSPEEFAIKRIWTAKRKWNGRGNIKNFIDDIPLIAASTERLVLTAGEYVGKDDPTILIRISNNPDEQLNKDDVIGIFQYPQVTLGFMRGSHIGPLVPGTQPSFFVGKDKPTEFKPEATPHFFDGPPPLAGLILTAGKALGEAKDVFEEVSWLEEAIKQGNFITQVLRRQGAFPPHKVDGAETEYTTGPVVMEAIKAEGRGRPASNAQEAQFFKSLLALQSEGVSHKLSEGAIEVARDAENKKVMLISSRVLRSDPSLILALQSINEQINQNLGVFGSNANIGTNAYRFVLVVDEPGLNTAEDVERLFAEIANATNNGVRVSKDMFAEILTQADMYDGTISNAADLLKQLERIGISQELIVALVGSKEWTGGLYQQEGLPQDAISVNVDAKGNEVAFAANALFGAVEVIASADRQITDSLAKKLELLQEAMSTISVVSKGVNTSVEDAINSYREAVIRI